jgi:alpha-1,3-glucan synthase
MIFPESDYASDSLTEQGDNLVFTHSAFGADMLRYSWNFGKNWSTWQNWEDTTSVPKSLFQGPANFWEGQHLMFQCQSFVNTLEL